MSSSLSKINSVIEKIKYGYEPANRNVRFPCGICEKNVNQNQNAVFCDQCDKWVHIKCNNISKIEYETFQKEPHNSKHWICIKCTIINNSLLFPFTLESDEVLLGLNGISLPSLADSLPSFETSSTLTNLPNLSDYDTDENLNLNISSQYCTVEEVASMAVPNTDLSLFHMNIGSLSLHFDELHPLLTCLNVNFQVIGLSEIKTSVGSQNKANNELPGYKFHETPSHSSAGGVGIYVKSNLTANKRDDLCISDKDFETVWIEIENSKAKNILCCCAYRHPSSEISRFSDYFQLTLSNLAKENKLIAVMGDFNIDLLKYDNHTPSNDFINMMFSYHFQPSILHPTRITDSSSTIIDNIYVNNATESNIFAGNILSLISDHLPRFAVLSENAPDFKTSSYFSYDYKAFDEAKFLADYKEMDTSFLDDGSQDLNGKFDTFLLNLHNLVNKHCPQKKLNKRALKLKNKPWINFQIQRMMKIREFKSTKSPNDLKAYKQFRNRIVNEIRESKKSHFHQYFDEHKNNMKMLWKGIKNIISIRPGNFDSVRFLKEENGSKISDPVKIANEFNNYFTNVADNTTKRIP